MPSIKEDIKQERRQRFNWFIVGVLLLAVVLLSAPATNYYDLTDVEPGEPSPRTFRAADSYRLVDVVETSRRRDEKIAEIFPQFIKDSQREQAILNNIKTNIEEIRSADTPSVLTDTAELPETAADWLETERVSTQVARFLLAQGVIEDKGIFDLFDLQQTGHLYDLDQSGDVDGIDEKEIDLAEFKQQLIDVSRLENITNSILESLYGEFEYIYFVKEIVVDNVVATIIFQEDKFQQQIEAIEREVEPVYKTVRDGETILSSGEIVSESALPFLEQINRREIHFQLFGGLVRLAMVLLGMVFLFLYFREYDPDFFEKSNVLGLIVLIVIAVLGASRLLQIFLPHLPQTSEFGFPFAAAVMLLTILVTPQVALLVSIFLAFLVISFFEFTFELFALFLLGGITAIFSVREVDRRTELMRSGVIVGAVQMLAVFLFYLLRTGGVFDLGFAFKLAWAGLNGIILVPFVVIGVLPFLENGFKITTNFKLQELADLNHPLLQKLFVAAPGSYQHSILLSNLCEQAAQAIGANALLVRAGTYFHDIGKAEIPEYFVENQGSGNPHDELKPTLSASILKTHVKKGVELARQWNLPEEIIGFIQQHHGTTRIQYFYHRALEESDEEVNEEEFRYSGPIPQFKEAAILMLGDSVEAATRTLENPTHKKIRELVQSIVYDKFKQGQLNQCELTLKDLDIIVETFTKVMASVHHKRISYPDEEKTEKLEEDSAAETNES